MVRVIINALAHVLGDSSKTLTPLNVAYWRIIIMKNTLLISLVAILGILSGGYYLYSNDELSGLVEYLPEPIAGFIAPSVPSNSHVESSQNSVVTAVENTNAVAFQATEVESSELATMPLNESSEELQTDTIDGSLNQQQQQQEFVEHEVEVETPEPEPLKAVENTDAQSPVKTAQVEKPSFEVLELESQIKSIRKTIGQLDGENIVLQEHFQKILKQNRTLAIKLKEIDKQLKVSSE